MSWMLAAAGLSALSIGTSYLSSASAANGQIRAANATSRAEGEAIRKERLNTSIRNSYSTALSQMNLGLKKRQLSQQNADISAAGLTAKADATLANAATGSVGATTDAVLSDINQKVQFAKDQTTDQFENAVENYNMDLKMMVLNTEQSAPTMRPVQQDGPSNLQMLGGAVISGIGQFASSYALRKIQLGLGDRPTGAQVPSSTSGYGINLSTWGGGGAGVQLRRY